MRNKLFSGLFIVLVALAVVSCGKSGDTTATITVLDVNNQPVPGALVRVVGYDSNGGCNSTPCRIDRETETNGSGQATFNFNDLYKRGAAGFAVLEVEASKNGMTGDGIIKVEEQVNNEAKVSIQ
ncbi:MAG TPA: hypothetical protein DEP18_03690 [Flavobacteriales bacterium]|nr:hypothetical protein [Flavobacteriales bacterium]HRE75373.1 hypothetical protein [Flavobacteriales bacterium]HRE95799.1 hypothetical protein [Flavobacteriales bacterium]HRJ36586.1 hypothetical protein [Flavobacteriales bacterium]HRJ37567.1 hypothetical protein [Flavobacteriales bacterium]